MIDKSIVLEVKELVKQYKTHSEVIHALRDVNFNINKGEIVALMGPSGSGKTSLLNIVGCMDSTTHGSIIIDDKEVSHLSNKQLIQIRRKYLGFVFQDNHLIPTLTAIENVDLPILFSKANVNGNAKKLLEQVGLGDRLNHLPKQLSGGQNQRVAIARALINKPSLILADEPTSRLDMEAKKSIFKIFQTLASEGIAILLATHDHEIAQLCTRTIVLRDGQLVSDN